MKCSYGCNRDAKIKLKNNKMCCESHFTKCPAVRERNSKGQEGRQLSDETKLKQSISHKKRFTEELKKEYSKRMIEKYKDPKERKKQKLIYEKIRKNKKHVKKHKDAIKKYFENNSRLNIDEIKIKHPLFFKVEQLRYKPTTKKIQVKCKFCNKWFTPTSDQLYNRINQLEHTKGNDGSYMYCSENCKKICPVYNLKSDSLKSNSKDTKKDYKIWKQTVLEIDNYTCQICGSKKNLHCHHIIPVKIEPMFSLDPYNGIVLCKTCHYEYGHKNECSTGALAYIKC